MKDEAKIYVKAGDGGRGACTFLREKYKEYGGPDGGNGGKGGDIIFSSRRDINTLDFFRYKNYFKSESGKPGAKRRKTGLSGKNLTIKVPVGTQILSSTKDVLIHDFVEEEEITLLKGGAGGAGNHCFKSSTNRSPRDYTLGEAGEDMEVFLELKVISDVGIIGFPNAGKSTFLSKISNAKPEIASYPFTTLEPKLGVVTINDSYVVFADVPGLVEGASQGQGLGIKFLKHIERCKMLVHLIDCSDDVIKSYEKIRTELSNYSKDIAEKDYIVCLSKTDLLDQCEVQDKMQKLKKHLRTNNLKSDLYSFSSNMNEGIKPVLDAVCKRLV